MPPDPAAPVASDLHGRDAVIGTLLMAGTVTYLSFWPHDLNAYDEGLFLYEAKRILHGDVPYRDYFQITAPGAWYLMALLFRLFGTTMETARGTMAGLHAVVVAIVYLACRRRRVRPLLAATASAAYLVMCFPLFAFASPHWFGTAFTLALLLVFLSGTGRERPRWWVLPGLLAGLMVAFQQHKGAVVVAGIGVLLLVRTVLAWTQAGSVRRPLAELAGFVAGVLIITVPVALVLVVQAGPWPVYRALVLHPLTRYREYVNPPWGAYPHWVLGPFPWLVFKYMPVLLPLAVGRVWWSRGDEPGGDRRGQLVLLGFCVLAILTVAYSPTGLYLGFIAATFIILSADLLDWALRAANRWGRGSAGRVGGWAVPLCLLAVLGWRLGVNLSERRAQAPVAEQTLFGRIDVRSVEEGQLLAALTVAVRDDPSHELFVFPYFAGMYLLTDTWNPTPYEDLIPGYSAPDQIAETLDILERRKTRYVLIGLHFPFGAPDPVTPYIQQKYERVDLGFKGLPPHLLFRRRE